MPDSSTPSQPPRGLAPDLLRGKTAWITGGGTGLGRALSARREGPLAETARAIRAAGGQAVWSCCDVRDPAAVDATLAVWRAECGGIDILVNNAAGNFLCPSEDLSSNAFAAVVDIVLKGTFHCTSAAGRYWIAEGRPGTVLNIAATYWSTGSSFVMPSACAKAGVVAMTRSLAVEWARHRIRLNAIAPGPIPTDEAFARLLPTEELAESRRRRIPAGRFGTPQELAELAAFLVSDATEWMRGEVVTFDGGEWLYGAGEFNELLELPAEVRDALGKRRS